MLNVNRRYMADFDWALPRRPPSTSLAGPP